MVLFVILLACHSGPSIKKLNKEEIKTLSALQTNIPMGWVFEFHRMTGEDSWDTYICGHCPTGTILYFNDAAIPKNSKKEPWRRYYSPRLVNYTPFNKGVDVLDEVDGNEFVLAGKSKIVERLDNRGILIAMDTQRLIEFKATNLVYELVDNEGQIYILYQYVDELGLATLPYMPLPEGWTYRTRVLDNPLSIENRSGSVMVYMNEDTPHLWQRYATID